MSNKVTIIDYGVGNLLNVVRAFEHCGADVTIAESMNQVANAEHLVLPGVGAFSNGMKELEARGLIDPLMRHVVSGKPLLGICLGMQMLLDESEEFGSWPGLGLIHGKVVEIPDTGTDGQPHKIPHIGWNELLKPKARKWEGSVLGSVNDKSTVYFVHSYMAVPESEEHYLAGCDYDGRRICAAVQRDNVVGCQFHPEKSGEVGLNIISEFLRIN